MGEEFTFSFDRTGTRLDLVEPDAIDVINAEMDGDGEFDLDPDLYDEFADVADATVHTSEGVELFVAEHGLDDELTARRLAASFWSAVLVEAHEQTEVGGFDRREFVEMRTRGGDGFTGARLAGLDEDTARAVANDVYINTDRSKYGPTGGVDGVAMAVELVRGYGTPRDFFGMPAIEFIAELGGQ